MRDLEGKAWYLYILQCGDSSLYVGITQDIDSRLHCQHQTGKGAKYTRGRGPLKVVYQEKIGTKSSAMKRELEIKRLSRKAKLTLLAR